MKIIATETEKKELLEAFAYLKSYSWEFEDYPIIKDLLELRFDPRNIVVEKCNN